jgi:hypothetical protein
MPVPARPPLASHPRPAAALVARVLVALGFAVFLLLAAGIVLYIFDADPGNTLVDLVLDAAGWFGGPFEGLFDAEDDKTQVVFDWGLAAIVYAMAAVLVAAVVDRVGRAGT